MTIILDQYAIPEKGVFEIRQTVNIQVSAQEAQRKVDTWLLLEVSMMMGAETPTLVIGERTVWRVPARFSAPHVGRVGTVGLVDVDVQTGELYNPAACKAAILKCSKKLAAKLPPFQVREVPSEYLAKNVPPAPKLQVTEDGALEITSNTEVR
jgi:hypothetical protein